MLTGPCAFTTAGAATAAALAAATFRKRRRVEALSLVGVVTVPSRIVLPINQRFLVIIAKTKAGATLWQCDIYECDATTRHLKVSASHWQGRKKVSQRTRQRCPRQLLRPSSERIDPAVRYH